jgi:hypothetical protein
MESYRGSNHMYRYNASLLLAVDCINNNGKGFSSMNAGRSVFDLGT